MNEVFATIQGSYHWEAFQFELEGDIAVGIHQFLPFQR